MNKKHKIDNPFYLTIGVSTIITFITVTIIEYTTTPKIYRVDYFFKQYGIYVFIINLLGILITNYYVKNTKNKKIKNINITIILVFLLIWIITTLIEYISHYYIDVYSHKMLWDYSKDFLNINKRVNWDASRNFAIGGTLLLYLVQPKIDTFLEKTNLKKKIIITLVFGIPMLIDLFLNVILKG